MDKFYERMKDMLGDEYDDFIDALNKPAVKGLYLNNKKQNIEKVLPSMKPHPFVKEGFIFDDQKYAPGKSPYFLAGLYYIQEPSAMLVANMIDIKEDDYVLDMCAAPGGKSCSVGAQLSDDGLLIANDISHSRAKVLSENIERFGLSNTIVTSTDPLRFVSLLDGFFDKIILDAPCSGEGMFRKLDQAVETWSYEKVLECASIQKNLIEAAYKLLREGGEVIYSTCTYSKEENEDIIEYALSNFDFELVPLPHIEGETSYMDGTIRCYPHKHEGEGHFIAKLKKVGSSNTIKPSVLKPHISKEAETNLRAFYKESLNCKVPPLLLENKGHIYAIKRHFPDLKNIRILRNGLYLGESKKNRFVPSYSLALTLTKDDVKNFYDFKEESEEIKKYIHGETLPANNKKGYGVIFVDGYPLSFYKESNAVKNLFPKGLRR